MSEPRQIQLGPNGMMNPDADKQCGAIDPMITLPEPIHIGGCVGCRKIIHEILLRRYGKFKEKTHRVTRDKR